MNHSGVSFWSCRRVLSLSERVRGAAMDAVPREGSDRVSIVILLLMLLTVIDYVYLPMFLFFALLDLSPALPYSAREKRRGTS